MLVAEGRFEFMDGKFYADASDLEFPPGSWPTEITLMPSSITLKLTAVRRDAEGDVQFVMYTGEDAPHIVYND